MTDADDLLQRALIDAEACAAVALKVCELPLSEALTVIFHGRRDLGTMQTYVAHGGARRGLRGRRRRAAARAVRPRSRRRRRARRGRGALRRPGQGAARRDRRRGHGAGRLGRAARGARRARDVAVDRSIDLRVRLPAHRLMPVALSAPERRLSSRAVCGARTLAEGRPPLGIVCAQQDRRARLSAAPTTRSAAWRTSSSAPPARPPHGAALEHQEASVHALPRAQRRRLPSHRLTAARRPRRSPRRAW